MTTSASDESDSQFAETVAWKGSTIFERLDALEESSRNPDVRQSDAADEVFERWRDVFDDPEMFERRLRVADYSPKACRRCLRIDAWPSDVALPEWTGQLEAFVAAVADYEGDLDHELDAYPFDDLFESWVAYAFRRLRASCTLERFSEIATTATLNWLLRRFAKIASEALYVEYKAFAAVRNPTILEQPTDVEMPVPTGIYDEFTEKITTADGLTDFLGEYPVLARHVLTTVRQWTHSVEELHERLADDAEALSTTFGVGDDRGTVADLEFLSEDSHRDGRVVVRLDFETGESLVYKPRTVRHESLFYDLLDDVSAETRTELRVPAVLAGDGYGWTKWLDHEGCDDDGAVARYYERVGVLLGAAYACGLNDCHFENVVANGEYPVVVDAETIAHPSVASSLLESDSLAREEVEGSVFGTGLLPFHHGDSDEAAELVNGGLAEPRLPNKDMLHDPGVWKHLNTDYMYPDTAEKRVESLDDSRNVPHVGGTERPPSEYRERIVEGFEDAYSTLEADASPVRSFVESVRGRNVRVLPEPTQTYARVLDAIRRPDALEDGAKVTTEFEKLLTHRASEEPALREVLDLYEGERTALKRLDVPRFTNAVSEDDIRHEGSGSARLLSRTGDDRVTDRLQSLSATDRRAQVDRIRASFDNHYSPVVDQRCGSETATGEDSASERLTDNEISARIESICDRIRNAARGTDGDPSWVHLASGGPDASLRIAELGDGVYEGRGGVAIFLAAAGTHLDDPELQELALGVLEQIGRTAEGETGNRNLGLSSGYASDIYALTTVGDLLGEERLLDDARRVAGSIPRDRIEDDEAFDVLGGTAGLALALAKLRDHRSSERVLDLARQCGDRLLDGRVEAETGHRVWPPAFDAPRPLTGFSHGAAGIAYALYRLSDLTGAARYRDAGREALDYEQTAFSPEIGTWRDLRDERPDEASSHGGTDPANETFTEGWCHGHAGKVSARIGVATVTGEPTACPSLDDALDRIEPAVAGKPDKLCCSNAGRADVLLRATSFTGDDTYRRRARELLNRACHRADVHGCFALPVHTPWTTNPTLFQGLAGVGYVLLRVLAPDETPCLLLWE